MIEFITLFLGALVTGPSQVELQVHPDVAAVEIYLDAQNVATLHGGTWSLEVDFGEELLPHLLQAIAYAGNGLEVGRASQWVNLTPKQTESLEELPAIDEMQSWFSSGIGPCGFTRRKRASGRSWSWALPEQCVV